MFSIIWKVIKEMFEKPAISIPSIKPIPAVNNREAFLTVIAVSEGTERIGDRGYNALFGGGIFDSYADHPRREFNVPRFGITTSAAGRYQIEAKTFDAYKERLKLPDFSPASQDAIAIELITERHAILDVDAGRVGSAVMKCSNIWASFQGNNYHQPTTPLGVLVAAFNKAGGKISVTMI